MTITKPIAPDTLIERLQLAAEVMQNMLHHHTAAMHSQAADALEANNRQLQELRMQAIADTGQLQEALEKNAEKDRQLQLCREALNLAAARLSDLCEIVPPRHAAAVVHWAEDARSASIEGVGE